MTFDPSRWRLLMRLGDRGPDVAEWQAILVGLGYDLRGDPPGGFGKSTHNATIGYQREHGLERDGEVGPKTRTTIGLPAPAPSAPQAGRLPEPAYIEARHWNRRILRPRTDLIVLHCTESPEASTRAERCAQNFATTDRVASAHRVFDDDSDVLCVPLDRIAYAAPGANHNGKHYEHCGYARQTREQWLDPFSEATLRRSARRAAQDDIPQDDIPPVFCDADMLRGGGARGITTHHEVSLAFGRSTHHDPGPHFPIDRWLGWVHEELKAAA